MKRNDEENGADVEPKGGVVPGKRLRRWVTLAVGLLLLAWVLSQVSLPQLATVLRHADAPMLAAALALGLLATALRAIRYTLFFPGHSRWLNLYGAFALMRLLNLAMPLRTGEVAFLGLLKRHGLAPSIAETLPVWLVLRLTDVSSLALLLLAASLHPARPEEWPAAHWIVLALAVAMALSAVATVAIAARYRTRDAATWLSSRLAAFRAGWSRVRGLRLMPVMVLAMAIAAAMIGVTTLAQLALASPLPWLQCALISVMILAVAMLPIHGPLGLGTFEVTWVGLMAWYDVPVPQAAGIAVGIRLLGLVLILIDGALGSLLLAIPETAARPPAGRRP